MKGVIEPAGEASRGEEREGEYPPPPRSLTVRPRLFTTFLVCFAGGRSGGECSGPARARRPVAQSERAQPPLRGSSHRTQSYSKGGGIGQVLDGGARTRQERELSWVPAALCIVTRAVKPVVMHSSCKLKNSSLGERAACGGWLVALTPSLTTLAQDGAALESKGLEPAGRVVYCCLSPPFLNLPSTPVKREAGRKGGSQQHGPSLPGYAIYPGGGEALWGGGSLGAC